MAEQQFSVSDIVQKAEQLMAMSNFDLATKFLERAVAREPNNTEAVELLGEAFMEAGNMEKAQMMFKRSIELDPEESGTKWMYIGQLQQGKDATQSYAKGIAILERTLSTTQDAEQVEMLEQQISSAYCSIAEIYMTDLCFEPNAEEECDEALQRALKHGTENPEVLQAMASFRLSQSRPKDAVPLMERAVAILNKLDEQGMPIPAFEFRVNTARILIEVGQFEMARGLLERLYKEDDMVLEVWMLLGLCNMKVDDYSGAQECFERSKEMLDQFLQVDPEDEHFKAQQRRLDAMVAELAAKDASGADNDMDVGE